jgi:hypothetical protein
MYKREDSYKRKSTYDTSKRGKNDFKPAPQWLHFVRVDLEGSPALEADAN